MSDQNGLSLPFYTPPLNSDNAELRLVRKLEKECDKKFGTLI
jgi:hypothetical protein